LKFTPRADGAGYDFTGPTRFDKLFTGIVSPRPAWMPHGPSGIENPMDDDYGRLLERVYAKVLVRPEGIEPPAYRFEACRSIHLSYGRTLKP
jgi:hypothetical protein